MCSLVRKRLFGTCSLENFLIIHSVTKWKENYECSACADHRLPLIEVQMRQSATDLDKILGLNCLEQLKSKLICTNKERFMMTFRLMNALKLKYR